MRLEEGKEEPERVSELEQFRGPKDTRFVISIDLFVWFRRISEWLRKKNRDSSKQSTD